MFMCFYDRGKNAAQCNLAIRLVTVIRSQWLLTSIIEMIIFVFNDFCKFGNPLSLNYWKVSWDKWFKPCYLNNMIIIVDKHYIYYHFVFNDFSEFGNILSKSYWNISWDKRLRTCHSNNIFTIGDKQYIKYHFCFSMISVNLVILFQKIFERLNGARDLNTCHSNKIFIIGDQQFIIIFNYFSKVW